MLSANTQKLIPVRLDITRMFVNESRVTAVKSTKAEGGKVLVSRGMPKVHS